MKDNLPNLDFEGKRLALDMLNITVYLDGESVKITGTISPEDSNIQVISITFPWPPTNFLIEDYLFQPNSNSLHKTHT